MKILISFFIILISSSINAQAKSIDKLISEIDNKQVNVVMQYAWYPKMSSEAGNEIVKLGKDITPKLISILEDSNKGIIAHFILTEIWKKELGNFEYGERRNENSFYLFYNQLNLFLKEDQSLYGKDKDLRKNKIRWKKFLKGEGSR